MRQILWYATALGLGGYVMCVLLLLILKLTTSVVGNVSSKELILGPALTALVTYSLCGTVWWFCWRRSLKKSDIGNSSHPESADKSRR